MTIIKGHVCKMCGGLLNIDHDRQVYVCPFCGVTYDYEYFREDDVMEVARRAVMRAEFGSAKEAFRFVLQKDPHNFEALRGIFLCSIRWKSMDPILNNENIHFSDKQRDLVYAIDNCLPEHRDYFEKICEAVRIKKAYKESLLEVKSVDDRKKSEERTLRELNDDLVTAGHFYITVADHLGGFIAPSDETMSTKVLVILLYLFVNFVVSGLFIIFALTYFLGWWVPIVAAIIIAPLIVLYQKSKKKRIAQIDSSITSCQCRISDLTTELRKKKTQSNKLHLSYKENAQEILDSDPLKKKDDEQSDDEEVDEK